MLVSEELSGKSQELTAFQHILKAKAEKLAVPQKAQAELIRKERELEEAKRELELTVEKRFKTPSRAFATRRGSKPRMSSK